MTASLRALVVDDERPARERVWNLLKCDARVEIAGCCGGGADAIAAIEQAEDAGRPVHILFVDVQMPELDGFGLIASLISRRGSEHLPVIVFVTAHDEYALRAFEAHAVDYLLKPFSDERFQATLDRAIRHVQAGAAQTLLLRIQSVLSTADAETRAMVTNQVGRAALDKILVKGPHRVRLLPVEQICWIEADGPYVKLHTRDGAAHLHRALLGSFDGTLDDRFVRIHRSAIVNIDVVQELRQDAHGEYMAVLRDQTEVRVGRRFRPRLEMRLRQSL